MRAGEATNAQHLCEQLAHRGLDVQVLTSVGHTGVTHRGITVHALMRRWSWREVPRLRRFLRRCSANVVYLMYLGWTYDFQFMSTFLPTIVKRTMPGTPVITRFENVGGAGPQRNTLASRLIRRALAAIDSGGEIDYQFGTLLRDSDAIVLLSSRHESVLEGHLAGVSRKCVLIPPPSNMRVSGDEDGRDRDRGRALLNLGADAFVASYIGFVYPGKGIETLLAGFKRAALDHPQLRLVVIGGSLAREFPDHPSYLETMQQLARSLGIADRVIWTGEYRAEGLEASLYLRASDVCVLPFDTGVKLNNSSLSSAAAHGLPIITTADDRLEPQFRSEENVLICPPRSPEVFAAAMGRLVRDGSLRQRLGKGSLRLAEEWYSWPEAIDKTLRLFDLASRLEARPAGSADVERVARR
jgi:glycosyltransferase involved in cell wall biosynthesis